jgi:ankyrin repeat domain-containing protein 50
MRGRERKAIVHLLVEKVADDIKTGNGWTILQQEAYDRHREVVRLLLDKKVLLETKDGEWGEPALVLAARRGQDAVVRLLLENGADVEARGYNEQTAMYKANGRVATDGSYGGHVAMLRLLLEKGANVEARDHDGRTALHRASYDSHEEIVVMLYEKGANIEAKDKNIRTALFYLNYDFLLHVFVLVSNIGMKTILFFYVQRLDIHRGHLLKAIKCISLF